MCGRCGRHASQQNRDRGTTTARGLGGDWQTLRAAKLAADPVCEIRTHCAGLVATEVDHILPRRLRPDLRLEWTNLASACGACHDAKTARDGTFGRDPHLVQTVLVCGAPGSGKATYVRERAQPGDLRVDYDALMQALSGLACYVRPPHLGWFVSDAIEAIYRRLAAREYPVRPWVIASMPCAAERQALAERLGALVVVLVPAEAVCLERVKTREGDFWPAAVREWWSSYRADAAVPAWQRMDGGEARQCG